MKAEAVLGKIKEALREAMASDESFLKKVTDSGAMHRWSVYKRMLEEIERLEKAPEE